MSTSNLPPLLPQTGEVFDLLSRTNAKLHVHGGRISGSLHVTRPTWAHVVFRGAKGETLEETLLRAIKELHRRMLEGMPRTLQTAPCAACGKTDGLRFIQSAKHWLCADCRRGIREMADERRRAKRPETPQEEHDEEMTPHPFNSRTPHEPGDDRDIWCKDCEYHRDHRIHIAASSSGGGPAMTPQPERQEKWAYLEAEPANDAPKSDNPSGLYCPDCRNSGLSHCAWPEYCGGMRRMKAEPR